MQLLAEEVSELVDSDFDIELLGFSDSEIDDMLNVEPPHLRKMTHRRSFRLSISPLIKTVSRQLIQRLRCYWMYTASTTMRMRPMKGL